MSATRILEIKKALADARRQLYYAGTSQSQKQISELIAFLLNELKREDVDLQKHLPDVLILSDTYRRLESACNSLADRLQKVYDSNCFEHFGKTLNRLNTLIVFLCFSQVISFMAIIFLLMK